MKILNNDFLEIMLTHLKINLFGSVAPRMPHVCVCIHTCTQVVHIGLLGIPWQ